MTFRLKKQVIDILRVLQKKDSEVLARDLIKEMNIDYIVLMSAVNDLIAFDLGGFKEADLNQVSLTEVGLDYLKKGLPERQLLNFLLEEKIKEINLEEFQKRIDLEKKVFYIGLSKLKKNHWITQSKATGENKIYLIAEDFPPTDLEKVLKKFENNIIINYSTFSKKDLIQLDVLNKRKLIKKHQKTQRIIYLSEKGKNVDVSKIEVLKQVSKLTSEMLSSGSWKEYDLKPFDVVKSGPLLKAGKVHPMIRLINEIREIFLSMGFTEIRGPIIESAFYNFDALFQPQDHPAREMQDTFYLNQPKKAKLPEDDRVQAVKDIHENGGDSGSRGWGYDWDLETAKRTVLRTHTTATTIRRLAQYYKENDKTPIKVFCIDRVFRNEKVDKSHLAG